MEKIQFLKNFQLYGSHIWQNKSQIWGHNLFYLGRLQHPTYKTKPNLLL